MSVPPSPVEQSSVFSSHAPVETPSSGFLHGMQSSPSPQPSCPRSAACGLLATSGMQVERQTPGALPTDEVQLGGTYWPPPWMIASGMQTDRSSNGVSCSARRGSTSPDGTQCAGPVSQHLARPLAFGSNPVFGSATQGSNVLPSSGLSIGLPESREQEANPQKNRSTINRF